MNIFTFPTVHPAYCRFGDDSFRMSDIRSVTVSDTGDASLKLLENRFPDIAVKKTGTAYTLMLTKDCGSVRLPDAADGTDAYSITVTEDGIGAAANTAAGLFYAVEAVLHFPETVPCMELHDRAAVPLRMLHWDLKGYLPEFDVLCDELRILAEYKVNAVLLELEDKYDYRSVKGFAAEGAYTYDELRELSRLAASLHIRIVPKLQSIAHVDYILKHPAFAHLRENGHVFQYCATNPGVQALWEKMASELMDVFREHSEGGYFHIGADEPGNLGECPECRKLGAFGSYVHKIKMCIDFVSAHGWKPVMWDDIVRNHTAADGEESLRNILGRDTVMMYWSYGYGGRNNEFPLIEKYISEGLTVFGASGYSGCDNWAGSVPPMETRALNIDAWTKAAVENGIYSVCATGWTRIGSADCPAEPQESSWFTLIYAALSMWTGQQFDYRDFCTELFREFYKTSPDEALLRAVMNIGKTPYSFNSALPSRDENSAPRLDFLRIAAALESLAGERGRILNYFQYYDGKLGNSMEDYRLGMVRGYTEQLIGNLKNWKDAARVEFGKYYKPVTVEEILRTRFGYLEKLAEAMKNLLDRTETM